VPKSICLERLRIFRLRAIARTVRIAAHHSRCAPIRADTISKGRNVERPTVAAGYELQERFDGRPAAQCCEVFPADADESGRRDGEAREANPVASVNLSSWSYNDHGMAARPSDYLQRIRCTLRLLSDQYTYCRQQKTPGMHRFISPRTRSQCPASHSIG
jgi:hypothetical protein